MATPKQFPVMAIRRGHYGYIREKGEIFLISDKEHFSVKWMRKMPLKSQPSRHIAEFAVDPRLTMEPAKEPETLYEANLEAEPNAPAWS